MLLRYTKHLMSWLHYDYEEPCAIYDDLYTWGATFIRAEGFHYHLLLRNSATGFALLIDTADGKNLPIISEGTVSEYLKRGLTAHGFDSEDVAFYLEEGERCTFTKEFESAYERKKLNDLAAWVVEAGLKEAQQSISSLPVTINRRKVDAKELFGDLLKERRKEITKRLYLAASVKVRLRLYSQYNVWRRFHLPLDLTYGSLHDIIQVAFGWDGSHLHEFKLGKWVRIMPRDDIERDFGWDDSELLDEYEVTLAEVSAKKMTYTYDFGDYWVHDITLEKVFTVEEEQKPICVAGEGSAPWEDCGGAWGYHSLLESLVDPDDPNHAYARSWAGLGYWDGAEDEEDEDEDEEEDEEEEGNDGTPYNQLIINARLSRMFR
jgi:hypothetical protein